MSTSFVALATWPFGQIAVRTAVPFLRAGKPALDAAVAGAQAVEDDPAVSSVGYGGLPNAAGQVQLDACIMVGRTLASGAVAGLENIRHAAAVARLVMERTPHLLLVGAGAQQFALAHGFPLENLTTPESLAEWKRRGAAGGRAADEAAASRLTPNQSPPRTGDRGESSRKQGMVDNKSFPSPPVLGGRGAGPSVDSAPPVGEPPFSHDTVTVLTLDRAGHLAGVCSTSGLAHKLPGRVGDSPILGAGLYVDDAAGAAGATGEGEEILRVGGSLLIVEALRAGRSPQDACVLAVRRVNAVAARRAVPPARVAFLALDRHGRTGAACTAGTNFQYAVARSDEVKLLQAAEIEN
jgi:N4-(beta-N-acetylglucosaminyl)-L-asparaginase